MVMVVGSAKLTQFGRNSERVFIFVENLSNNKDGLAKKSAYINI